MCLRGVLDSPASERMGASRLLSRDTRSLRRRQRCEYEREHEEDTDDGQAREPTGRPIDLVGGRKDVLSTRLQTPEAGVGPRRHGSAFVAAREP